MKFYYGVNPSEKREMLIKSSVAKPFIDEIISSADVAIGEDNSAFKMSEYSLFYKTGNRTRFQKNYFDRRRKCSNIMFAYWLTQDEKYLEPLVDYITYICDEFTWCVPAHCDMPGSSAQETIEWVDLFQAETARLFAEIVMCVGDKLPNYTRSRMEYEIRRRIFASLERNIKESNKYWWENCKMNWATVCGAGCTMAALYFGTKEETQKYVSRFTQCLDSYLDGIENDGCCQEGMSYWNYGFGHFVILAEAVKVYSDGEIDYFKNPKVRELSLFPQRIRMSASKVASISDGRENYTFKIGLMSFLKSLYGEILLPEIEYGIRSGSVDSVCELLWLDENYKSDKMTYETNYLSDSQWYVSRREKFSFAAKGGHNNEPHNHNDIGSFMINVGEESFISDLGCGEYVKETFKNETRYNFIQNSSRGHSVPIVNGGYQCFGAQFSSENAKASDSMFELDIQGAYESGSINRIRRQFMLDDNKVTLVDTFDFAPDTQSVTERFISKKEPLICDGHVDFGVGKIVYDKKRYIPSVSTEDFVLHNGVDIITVYIIDFAPALKEEKEFKFEFIV
ncbi:MAG: heparinase II/III family protein [Clostridia bacterium]|nr:heparinase II/III family protein [Clostridia bacterium]